MITVQQIPCDEARPWLLLKHYAKRVPGSVLFAFGLFVDNKLSGVITFGMSPNYHNNKVGRFKCLELNRMVIDCSFKNIGSTFISRCFALLPKPMALISYADEGKGHFGYVYQATNWIYTGTSDGAELYEMNNGQIISKRALDQQFNSGTRSDCDVKSKHEKSIKHRYFMFLGCKRDRREMLESLNYDVLLYPKGKTQRYDASATVQIQGVML